MGKENQLQVRGQQSSYIHNQVLGNGANLLHSTTIYEPASNRGCLLHTRYCSGVVFGLALVVDQSLSVISAF